MNKSFLSPTPATVAVEITRHRVSGASVSAQGHLSVTSHAVELVAPGSVVPSLNTPNISDPLPVVAALRRVFERMSVKPKRVALAVPDAVAKVSLLKFEKVPERSQDLDELVRWQVRKAAPFRIEDAQLSYVPGHKASDGSTEFVVVVARRDIVREYEAVCEAAGAQAGLVDITTFNVINSVLAGSQPPSDDWLLVNVADEDATMAILRGSQLVFFRNREADGEAGLADLVHQTAMYYEDRLSGAGFRQVILAGAGAPWSQVGPEADYLRRALEERLGTRVNSVDPRNAATLADRISANAELLDMLAPLVGLLARDRAA